MVDELEQGVLLDDFVGNDYDRESHVLVAIQWGVQLEVFEVDSHELGAGCG